MEVLKKYQFHDGEFTSLDYTDDSLLLTLSQVYEKKKREYLNNVKLHIKGISLIELHLLYDIKKKKNISYKKKNVTELVQELKTYGYILSFNQSKGRYNLLIDMFHDYLVEIKFKADSLELIV